MIKISNVPYTYQTRGEETYRYEHYFMGIIIWMIGLPLLCLVPILPVVFLYELVAEKRNLFLNRALFLSAAGLGMMCGFWILLKHRAADCRGWQDRKQKHQEDADSAVAEQIKISNITQYWSIISYESANAYLLHTREREWFYLIDPLLDEFEEDTFPRSEVTLLRAPQSRMILDIQTSGEEVEFVDFVEDDLYYEQFEDSGFGTLKPEVCESLKPDTGQ